MYISFPFFMLGLMIKKIEVKNNGTFLQFECRSFNHDAPVIGTSIMRFYSSTGCHWLRRKIKLSSSAKATSCSSTKTHLSHF